MFGDATNWDEEAYREGILKGREMDTLTVFRTAWAPSLSPDLIPDTIVAASSDGSLASYSVSSRTSSAASQQFEPHGFLQAHDGPVYDVKFYGDGEDALLLSCGDDGRIRGWRWREFSSGNHRTPMLDLVNPQHKGPWGALSPIPENNAIAIDSVRGSIFAAAGDSCAYWWDVETCKVKMVFKGHLDYLHCVVARNSANQIITGSEDGTARIWDCKSSKPIQVIDLKKDKNSKRFSSYVSCIALDSSETWLACGSGRCLTVWNLPASECVSRTSCLASVQDVTFDDNQVVAVGGYGGLVDIISQFGSHYCTFHCRCA